MIEIAQRQRQTRADRTIALALVRSVGLEKHLSPLQSVVQGTAARQRPAL